MEQRITLKQFLELDLNIARARAGLSLVALVSIYLDPAMGGAFFISRYALVTMILHLTYSLGAYVLISRRLTPRCFPTVSTGLDVLFAAAIVLMTEGATSASYMFFVFAIIAMDCRTGFREALAVTFCSGLVYFLLLAFAVGGPKHLYAMRAAYLTITGYLIGFIGQQRANFQARVRELENNQERQRIARSLHDGYVQSLAGMALRLEACRELLRKERTPDAALQLSELQTAVSREFDEVRAYLRSLADIDQSLSRDTLPSLDTRFRLRIDVTANGLLVEQIIQIMLEGMRNVMRHGKARTAAIDASEEAGVIRIAIDDDGVGFANTGKPPWAIASRVAEFGGSLHMTNNARPGAHLQIEMPVA